MLPRRKEAQHPHFSAHPTVAKRSPTSVAAEQLCNRSAVAEIGNRLATTDMGRKVGAAVPLSVRELGPTCRLGRGLPPYQVVAWSIQPFRHNRHGPKSGGCCAPFRGGKLGPHPTQCGPGRGLSLCRVVSWCIQPFGHSRHGPKSGGCCAPFRGGSCVPI